MPAPGPRSKGVTFAPNAARRVVAAVKRLEAMPQLRGRGDQAVGLHGWIPGAILVRSPAGGIPACAIDGTPGAANCTRVILGTDGKLADDGSVGVLNVYPLAVGASRLCWCAWWHGRIAVQTEACPA
jgi:hypothetical protein